MRRTREMVRTQKIPDPQWEYCMVFVEKGVTDGLSMAVPAGMYEDLGKPNKLTLTLEAKDVKVIHEHTTTYE